LLDASLLIILINSQTAFPLIISIQSRTVSRLFRYNFSQKLCL